MPNSGNLPYLIVGVFGEIGLETRNIYFVSNRRRNRRLSDPTLIGFKHISREMYTVFACYIVSIQILIRNALISVERSISFLRHRRYCRRRMNMCTTTLFVVLQINQVADPNRARTRETRKIHFSFNLYT